MKKPIIRNWIKYWTTTIAVSGMLVVGACGDSNEKAETVTTETEVVAPVQEPVADTEIEVEEEPVAQIENTAPVSDFPSTYIDNMDEHLQEFSSVNERITETLFREDLSNPINIEMEDQQVEDGNITGQDASYGQRGNNDVPQQTTTSDVEMQPDEGEVVSPTGNNNQQTGAAEYNTNRQGTTEMDMENNTQGEQPSQSTDLNQQGNTGQNQTPNNNQGVSNNPTQERNRLDTNEQDTTTNVYENQSNTNLNEGPDAVIIRLEQYTADYDEESRQRLDEAVSEYKNRRESMRGQQDPESGAYVSPEMDPRPTVGMEQLMNQIQENLEYPQNAAAAELEGTIFVNFVVDESGNVMQAEAQEQNIIVPVTSMEYTQPLNPTKFSEQEIEEAKKEMIEEAVKAVEQTSGQWIPAQHEGQNVKAEMQVPVVFDIENIAAPEDVPLQE